MSLLQLWSQAMPALAALASAHNRDSMLRLELFQLLLVLLDDDSKAAAWQQLSVGRQLVLQLLEPGLVWHAGRVAAAMRLTALSALASLLAHKRLPADQLADLACSRGSEAAESGTAKLEGLLARVASCMDEDHEPDTRQLACHVIELLMSSGERMVGKVQDGIVCSCDATACNALSLCLCLPGMQLACTCLCSACCRCSQSSSSGWTTAATVYGLRHVLPCCRGCTLCSLRQVPYVMPMPADWQTACSSTLTTQTSRLRQQLHRCWSNLQLLARASGQWLKRWRGSSGSIHCLPASLLLAIHPLLLASRCKP